MLVAFFNRLMMNTYHFFLNTACNCEQNKDIFRVCYMTSRTIDPAAESARREEFHDLVRAFKSARLCCLVQVQNLHPNAASLAELWKFSFLNNGATIKGLVNELPRYLTQLVCCCPEATSSAAKFCFGWTSVQPHESFFHPSTGECTWGNFWSFRYAALQ